MPLIWAGWVKGVIFRSRRGVRGVIPKRLKIHWTPLNREQSKVAPITDRSKLHIISAVCITKGGSINCCLLHYKMYKDNLETLTMGHEQ